MARISLMVLFCLLGQPVAAELWKNANQQGFDALTQGDYAQALEAFTDPLWRAETLQRSGQYEQAAEAYLAQETTTGLYNAATALAHAENLEAAIATYEQVLEQNPEHADAKFNLELLQSLQNPQSEPQPNPDAQDSQSSDSQSSDTQSSDSQSSDSQSDKGAGQQSEQSNDNTESGADNNGGPADSEFGDNPPVDPDNMPEPTPADSRAERDSPEPSPQARQAAPDQATQQKLQRVPEPPPNLLYQRVRMIHMREHRDVMDSDQW